MNIIETNIKDALLIEPKVFNDERGFFLETFQAEKYAAIGIKQPFVQDNYSRSSFGVLRGLHFQQTRPQGKLIRVVRGKILDIIVDCRRESATFGQWFSTELSEESKCQLWIPPGLAHGFVSLSNTTDIEYKCTEFYDPSDEKCLAWNDPTLKINWPDIPFIISDKDKLGRSFKELFL